MELNFTTVAQSDASVLAAYACPCGCHPEVRYQRGATAAHDTCCCGNEFAVGEMNELLPQRAGLTAHTERFSAPWSADLTAAWNLGPSVHADDAGHHHDDGEFGHGSNPSDGEAGRAEESSIDPVCGMTVDPAAARAKGLRSSYADRDYFFCGRGCKLDFDEDPERYLDPNYVPSM